MIRYLYGDALDGFPKLKETMFQDRADQFKKRLEWDVDVDPSGHERDSYDDLNPLYVLWQQPDGRHGGSMRFLPTTGRTMLNDHFTTLTSGVEIRSPFIWECTRFCLSATAGPHVSAALMLGGVEVGLGFHLTDAVGVFDPRMERIYRKLGWQPTVLGRGGSGRMATAVGLWAYSKAVRTHLLWRAGIGDEVSTHWFQRSFGSQPLPAVA